MIKKIIQWAIDQFGPKKDHEINAWPFPVVLGTPPACSSSCGACAETPVAKKRGRPAGKKPAVKAKATTKRTSKKKVK